MPDIAKQFEDVADDFGRIFTQNTSIDEMTFHLYRTAAQAGGVAWDAAKAFELNKLSGAVESAEKLWGSIQQAREKSEECKELLSMPDDDRQKIEKELGESEYFDVARSLFWPEVVMPWAWKNETLKPHSMRSPYSSLDIVVSMPCASVRTGEN